MMVKSMVKTWRNYKKLIARKNLIINIQWLNLVTRVFMDFIRLKINNHNIGRLLSFMIQ